jgi:predicted permease
MLKSYFLIAWRNFLKDRQFTALNLIGLSTGMACSLLIYLWVIDEYKIDKYNEKDQQLYQVMVNNKSESGIKTGEYTPGLLGAELSRQIPEIEYATTVLSANWFPHQGVLGNEKNAIKAKGQFVSRDFFNVFTCPYVQGEKNSLFNGNQSVAISSELAQKLFHNTSNVIGKPVKWDLDDLSGDFIVSGVFDKTPANATMQYDLLLNFDYALEKRPDWKIWSNNDPNTYVILKKNVDVARVNSKIANFVRDRVAGSNTNLFLAKYSDKWLYGKYENGVQAGGRISYVKLFSLIAAFILIIACINFMNLSTAKASGRLKEVGIKKVMGAGRSTLILQYLGESVLMATVSLVLAVVLIILLLPAFNQITGKALIIEWNGPLLLSIVGITLVTGLLSGSYPALYLSAFNPISVLKGKLMTSFGEVMARRALVIFQFSLSVVFIAAVLIIYRQVNFIQSKNLGYNRDHLAHFEIPLVNDEKSIKMSMAFLEDLKKIPGVVSVGSYYHNLTGDHGSIAGFQWPGKNPATDIDFANLEVGNGFIETMAIQMKEGRSFSQGEAAMHEIVFNESAIRAMGLKDPIGKKVKFWDQERTIVGVTRDFNFESLYSNLKPCFFQAYPVMPNVVVRVESGTDGQTLSRIEKAYQTFHTGLNFEYRFLDEDYRALYATEKRISVLCRYFAGLAIVISCLGLFGVAAFTAQRRQKEIGIRKVVGASVSSLSFLLSKEFLALVVVAILIAYPLVWYGMNNWLNSFAYRINISWDIFVITAFAALFITLLTVSFQTIKTALMNPVNSLRSE